MTASSESGSILIVEDDADIRESLKDIFQDEGFAVRVAANGQEGLGELGGMARVAIVILDLIMPVMGGRELLERMRANPATARIPVIITTSDPAGAPPGTLVMRKPLDLERLLDTVRKMLG